MNKRAAPRDDVEDPGFYSALGLAIKGVRRSKAMSRRALAVRSGLSYPYLAELENGRKRMSARALQLVSRALGVRPYQLLEKAESPDPEHAGDHSDPDPSALVAEIERELVALSPADLLALHGIVMRLAADARS
jgi:transcriptional regulator with XRE-family HTH domain